MSAGKIALITGITGQDGAYLSEYLLNQGYEVHGLRRRSSVDNTIRISHLYQSPHNRASNFYLHYGDLTDSSNLFRIIHEVKPTEIYNLGAQSHVKVSFESPEYTANSDAIGVLRILEAIRILKLEHCVRFYQGSTSEIFGNPDHLPIDETTVFKPCSPYGVAKLYAYWITRNYREAYGIYACNGFLFNHESPLRGETFITRKITIGLANIVYGNHSALYLGNLDAQRDWGHAADYIRSMHMMLQQHQPDDYVIATGVVCSVREFARKAFALVGIQLEFIGKGIDEQGVIGNIDKQHFIQTTGKTPEHLTIGQTLIRVDSCYHRPKDVNILVGNADKAKCQLGWMPRITLEQLIQEMVSADLVRERVRERQKLAYSVATTNDSQSFSKNSMLFGAEL